MDMDMDIAGLLAAEGGNEMPFGNIVEDEHRINELLEPVVFSPLADADKQRLVFTAEQVVIVSFMTDLCKTQVQYFYLTNTPWIYTEHVYFHLKLGRTLIFVGFTLDVHIIDQTV